MNSINVHRYTRSLFRGGELFCFSLISPISPDFIKNSIWEKIIPHFLGHFLLPMQGSFSLWPPQPESFHSQCLPIEKHLPPPSTLEKTTWALIFPNPEEFLHKCSKIESPPQHFEDYQKLTDHLTLISFDQDTLFLWTISPEVNVGNDVNDINNIQETKQTHETFNNKEKRNPTKGYWESSLNGVQKGWLDELFLTLHIPKTHSGFQTLLHENIKTEKTLFVGVYDPLKGGQHSPSPQGFDSILVACNGIDGSLEPVICKYSFEGDALISSPLSLKPWENFLDLKENLFKPPFGEFSFSTGKNPLLGLIFFIPFCLGLLLYFFPGRIPILLLLATVMVGTVFILREVLFPIHSDSNPFVPHDTIPFQNPWPDKFHSKNRIEFTPGGLF